MISLSHCSRKSGRRLAISQVAFVVAIALVVLAAQTASACPSCKAALANQEGKGDLVSGMMYSILFMLSMPFAIFGSISSYFYYLVRRARREQELQRIAETISSTIDARTASLLKACGESSICQMARPFQGFAHELSGLAGCVASLRLFGR